MFTINLYSNTSENNKFNKTLNPIANVQGTLKESCSIQDPSMLIQMNTVPNANYAYIEEFHRYYFITKVTSIKNNLWQVEMHVDVLESFKNEILANEAIIERQEHLYNMYLKDDMIPIVNETFTLTNKLGDVNFNKTIYTILVKS